MAPGDAESYSLPDFIGRILRLIEYARTLDFD
jgi:hypothetical protein